MKKKKHTKKQGNSLVFQQYGNGGLHDMADGTNIFMDVPIYLWTYKRRKTRGSMKQASEMTKSMVYGTWGTVYKINFETNLDSGLEESS
jgi:hypothetical protein